MICSMIYITLTFSQCQFPTQIQPSILKETAEKGVQDTSYRGFGGVPQLHKSPKIGGYRGVDQDYFSSLL